MTDIRVHKSGEDLLRDGFIGVNSKPNGKFEIRGAVIRFETSPAASDFEDPNYKVSVWVPNSTYMADKKKGGKQFEINTKGNGNYSNYITFKEFMKAVYEAVTGAPPKTGRESVSKEIFGFSVSLKESIENNKETIKESIDPLTEVIKLPKQEVKVENKVTVTYKGVTSNGVKVTAKGHDGSCQCDECRAVQAALNELIEGRNKGTSQISNDEYMGYA